MNTILAPFCLSVKLFYKLLDVTFVMCYYLGMNDLTMEQAALILGVSRQTIYNRLADMPDGSSARDIVDAEVKRLEARIQEIQNKLLVATPA